MLGFIPCERAEFFTLPRSKKFRLTPLGQVGHTPSGNKYVDLDYGTAIALTILDYFSSKGVQHEQ